MAEYYHRVRAVRVPDRNDVNDWRAHNEICDIISLCDTTEEDDDYGTRYITSTGSAVPIGDEYMEEVGYLIPTPLGIRLAREGSWIVLDGDNHAWVYDDRCFREQFCLAPKADSSTAERGRD